MSDEARQKSNDFIWVDCNPGGDILEYALPSCFEVAMPNTTSFVMTDKADEAGQADKADKPKGKPTARRDQGVATDPRLIIIGKMPRPPEAFKTKLFDIPIDLADDIKKYCAGPETVAVVVLLRMQIETLKDHKGTPICITMPDYIETFRGEAVKK